MTTHNGPTQGPSQTPDPSPQPAPKKSRKWLKWTLGVLAALVVIGLINGAGGEPNDVATADANATAPAPAPVAPPAPADDDTQQQLDELQRKLEAKTQQLESQNASTAPAAPAAPAPASGEYQGYGQAEAKYGEEVTAGDLVVSAKAPKTLSQQFLGDQVCAEVSYRNTGTTSESFNMFDWKLRTAQGVEATANIPFNAGKDALNSGQLTPGGTTSGLICGDQQTTDVTSIVYNPGFGIMHEVAFTK